MEQSFDKMQTSVMMRMRCGPSCGMMGDKVVPQDYNDEAEGASKTETTSPHPEPLKPKNKPIDLRKIIRCVIASCLLLLPL